jgi:hypothetical protein
MKQMQNAQLSAAHKLLRSLKTFSTISASPNKINRREFFALTPNLQRQRNVQNDRSRLKEFRVIARRCGKPPEPSSPHLKSDH